jgi:transposase
MELYVGMDVSLKETSICVVNGHGEVMSEGTVTSNPEAIARFLADKACNAVRIGLESGPTSTWLWHALRAFGLPVICIDARHAKAALSMQINKSDRNDAVGIGRIMQAGWYREVQVKRLSCHAVRAVLNSRALLVKMKRDLENQIRGLLKNFGLVIGKAGGTTFAVQVKEYVVGTGLLHRAVSPLLEIREHVVVEIAAFDREALRLARNDVNIRRLMTIPGIGPISALSFAAAIDEPARFKRSRSVGAYIGLTPRRYASGEIDRTGHISKCGDTMLRSYLFEAAGVLLTRVARWCGLKAWGIRLAKRIGFNKARVAVARKLAVIMHRMWTDRTDFQWSKEEAAT